MQSTNNKGFNNLFSEL